MLIHGKCIPKKKKEKKKRSLVILSEEVSRLANRKRSVLLVLIHVTPCSRAVFAGELLSLLQQWYTSSMNVMCTWLTDRMDLQLHIYQLKTLIRIVKVTICV